MPADKGRVVNAEGVHPTINTGEGSGAAVTPQNIGQEPEAVPAMADKPIAPLPEEPNRSITGWRDR